ncbi:MAG TPA: hypothetical protein VFF76_05400 [Holophagaceae bacterium]|jgi:hypothetical protein|nr:hypothetical protein [Holophagaceae bacterium]
MLKRLAISNFAASAYRVTGTAGDIILTILIMIRYEDWFAERGIHLGGRFSHGGNGLGYLCLVALFWACHAVVCYFLTLTWFLSLDEESDSRTAI